MSWPDHRPASPSRRPAHCAGGWLGSALLAAIITGWGCSPQDADRGAGGGGNGGDAGDTASPARDAGADARPGDVPPADVPAADTPAADTPAAACPSGTLGRRLGRDRLLVGGTMEDDAFSAAPFDLRYVYLAGPVADPPCTSCAQDCVVDGQSCANADGGCGWWGCWQYDVPPPGRYVADFITSAEVAGAVPMFSYYIWLTVSEAAEGAPEVAALDDGARLRRYLADWRFFAQTVADTTTGPVIAHIEPDLWGYIEHASADPTAVPVAVSSAGAAECQGLGDHAAGFAACLMAIARAEAPNLLLAFHASAWGAGADAYINADPSFDLLGHADQTAAFFRALGADRADLLVVEMSDRDAGFNGRWWDDTDTTLPDFRQARSWAARVAADLGLPYLWWQVPYGHVGLENACDRYEDNRVAYCFDHAADFAADGALGIAFGAGAGCMTTPASDDGYFVGRAADFYGGERPCLCGSCTP
jgi:hypothetical protein